MTSAAVDLTTVPDELERLAATLLGSGQRVPEISAACDALACAAVLLRTQRNPTAGDAGHVDLLHESLGLARSVVETTKYACRARPGGRRGAGLRL